MRRNDTPAALMIVRLANRSIDPEKRAIYMKQMEVTLLNELRAGDPFTKVGANQFWVLLPGATGENGGLVSRRVFNRFQKEYPKSGAAYTFKSLDLRHIHMSAEEKATEKTERRNDMYPLYWTPSRGGIIMRYTYEYKRKCVELYREGKWPETPEGVSDKSFRDKVRLWVRAEDSRGPEALKHKNFNRNWTPEERLELVSQVMSGKSCVSVAIEAGIQDRLLYQWVQNYKTKGYNGLVEMKKGRPSKGVPQMKKEEARPLNESEREELIRLRAENEYIKAENEVIKKRSP